MLLMKEYVLNFEEKQPNLGLPSFKLLANTNNILRLNPLFFLAISCMIIRI